MAITIVSSIVGLITITSSIFIINVLRSKYNSPEKSLFWCALNSFLAPIRLLKLGPFKDGKITLEKAMKYAMKKEQLTDFGDMTFVKSYNLMITTDAHKSLKLTNLGYVMYRLELFMSMTRRLKFIDYLKSVPEVLNIPVPSPVFVLGLPRTGTTFLHRLLSLDPRVRAPLLWELLSVVPKIKTKYEPKSFQEDREFRQNFIRKLIKDRKRAGDNAMEKIHEIGADLPEECLLALSDEIPIHLSFLYSIYLNHEKFFTDIDSKKVANAYFYYKKVLQLLSYQIGEAERPRRWMLKCPIHIFYTKEIATAFPDAKLIWTHRHPVSAVPSMCSLVKAVHQVYYTADCRNDALLGKKVAELTAESLKQAPKDITSSNLSCSNVIYNDLIKDPIQIIKNIYQEFQWEFTSEYENILQNYLEQNKKDRNKLKSKKEEVLHHYTPEEFSLTSEELSTGDFEEYCQAFNVPMSKN